MQGEPEGSGASSDMSKYNLCRPACTNAWRGGSHVPHVGRELVLEPGVLDYVGDGAALVGVWDQDLSGKFGHVNTVWIKWGLEMKWPQ